MRLTLTESQRADLEAAAAAETARAALEALSGACCCGPRATPGRRRATLGCSQASVYAWTAAWRRQGVARAARRRSWRRPSQAGCGGRGGAEGAAGDRSADTGHRATGWTVPLLQTELARAGYAVGERTIRRALHRLGLPLEAAAVRAGTARSGLRRKKGAVIAQARAMLAAGGEVWVADETALREFPPLRAGWSKRGEPAHGAHQRPQRAPHHPRGAAGGTGELVTRCASAAAPTMCSPRSKRWGRCGPTCPSC